MRYPCIWQVHMGMEGIWAWVYGVGLTWDCDSNAPVEWGVYSDAQLQRGGMDIGFPEY